MIDVQIGANIIFLMLISIFPIDQAGILVNACLSVLEFVICDSIYKIETIVIRFFVMGGLIL
jgi:hypothetical protein